MLWKLILQCLLFSGGMFFAQTPVSRTQDPVLFRRVLRITESFRGPPQLGSSQKHENNYDETQDIHGWYDITDETHMWIGGGGKVSYGTVGQHWVTYFRGLLLGEKGAWSPVPENRLGWILLGAPTFKWMCCSVHVWRALNNVWRLAQPLQRNSTTFALEAGRNNINWIIWVALLVQRYLSNTASFVLYVFRRVQNHHTLLH